MFADVHAAGPEPRRLITRTLSFILRYLFALLTGAFLGFLVGMGLAMSLWYPKPCPQSLTGFHGICFYITPLPPAPSLRPR